MAVMMKAAVFEKPGVIKVKEVPVPEIAENEVLIKVKYTGICGTDWSIYNGWYSADKLPMIPGHEFSGVIARLGKNARGIKEGDRVCLHYNITCGDCYDCSTGNEQFCPSVRMLGHFTDGGYAEYARIPANWAVKLPKGMTLWEAMAFGTAGYTAGLAILDTMRLVEPDIVTYCVGQAASMAAVLLAAGTKGKRHCLPHARVMLHQPWGGVQGTASDISIQAEEILKTKKRLNEIIAQHTGKTIAEVEKDTDRDNYMSSQQAADYGLIDKVLTKRSNENKKEK